MENIEETEDNAEPIETEDNTEVTETAPTETDEPETFPRDYVEKLRDENKRYRQKASDRDTLAQDLFIHRVAATNRLADPTDLPYSEDLLNDAEALDAAITALLERKPHLASRAVTGDIGQGARGAPAEVNLLSLLGGNV